MFTDTKRILYVDLLTGCAWICNNGINVTDIIKKAKVYNWSAVSKQQAVLYTDAEIEQIIAFGASIKKIWISLFMCCAVHAIHFELVPAILFCLLLDVLLSQTWYPSNHTPW